ncbi:prephenate dehydratase [Brevibacterium sanguinis]|uniref:Prephenate dehydratase n=2 Tax=Brevibacterium TaxID=1696 RepID=A0A366ILD3_9MICO|nr:MULTISPECIES: prephenate dehydratase [Brevibacterium]RBP67003.1 prephenate dehydratase [Brevibacterium sanguinis]RBP73528.1 prephenate dehydratase [Brevibacterium celere]
MTRRFAYLGPEATFTEAALLKYLDDRGQRSTATIVPMRGAASALESVLDGDCHTAVVPIENSVEGGVPATIDALTEHGRLQIVAEVVVPVRFVLAVKPGTAPDSLISFGTHPHGEAQVRGYMSEHYPDAIYIPTSSTAAAARDLANDAGEHVAAVCPALAAERYGLDVVAEDIGDNREAVTRFVVVERPGRIPEPTGADKTTIVAALRSNRSGALLELLEQFSTRGVNMSRIESRPTGDGLGLYQFSIDLQGHIREARMAEALQGVHRIARRLEFLGSYPAADEISVLVDPTTTDASFSAAADWLESTLHGS